MDSLPPPRLKPRIKAAPRIRSLYWCDFPQDAQAPEFWKTRPIVVISKKHSLRGTVTIIPCTTDHSNSENQWAYKLETTIDDREAWAIFDKITTVAVSRLTLDKHGPKRIRQNELEAIMDIVLQHLPSGTH